MLGWGLLALPVSQDAPAPPLDSLFIAIAALSGGGGLSPIDIGPSLSSLGEGTLLLLMQAGRPGCMTLGSFAYLAISDQLVVDLWRLLHGEVDALGFSSVVILGGFPVLVGGGAHLRALAEPSISTLATSALAITKAGTPLATVAFEVISCLSTLGFSQCLTAEVWTAGHAILILPMFAGRVGLITFAIAIALPPGHEPYKEGHDLVL